MSDEPRPTYQPQLLDGSAHTPTADDAYVRVRVSGDVGSAGAVSVYLPDGTALVVPGNDLIRLTPVGAVAAAPTGRGRRSTRPARRDPDRGSQLSA